MSKTEGRCRDSFRDMLWENRDALASSIVSGCADCRQVGISSLEAVGWDHVSFLTACLFGTRDALWGPDSE